MLNSSYVLGRFLLVGGVVRRQCAGLVTGDVQVNFQLPQNLSAYGGQITCQLQIGAAVSSRFAIFVIP